MAKQLLSGRKAPQAQTNGAVPHWLDVAASALSATLPTMSTPMPLSVGPNVVGQPLSEIKAQMEIMLDELPFQESHLRDAHAYAMALGPDHYDPRDAWLRVGWALRNTSAKLFGSWVLFSSRSKKFNLADVPDMLKPVSYTHLTLPTKA